MSKISRAVSDVYIIVQVDSFDGTTTYELRRNNETIKSYPAEALQHAIDGLTRIEQFQGLTSEAEMYKYVAKSKDVKSETEES